MCDRQTTGEFSATFSSPGSVLLKMFVSPRPVPSLPSQMVSKVSATTDVTVTTIPLACGHAEFPAVGVYCEVSSCSVTVQIFGAGYFSLPRCFHLLLLPLQMILLFVYSGPSFLCQSLVISFLFFLLLPDLFLSFPFST